MMYDMQRQSVVVFIVAGAILNLASAQSGEALPVVGTIPVSHPGQLNIYTSPDATDSQSTHSVLVSTWETGDPYDEVLVLVYPGLYADSNLTDVDQALISNILHYPKETLQVPEGIFSFAAVSIADGQITDGVTSGTLYISDVTNLNFPATTDILDPVNPEYYMYSDLVWKQVDGGTGADLWDIVTCRVQLDGDTIISAQLVWLEQPLIDWESRWNVGVLKESACDSYLALGTFLAVSDPYEVIFTTGFYSTKLAFFWSTDAADRWNSAEDIVGEILDMGRQYLDVQIVDLNNDGKLDVIATVVAHNDGSVEVWEVPSDFRNTDQYVRHVIAMNFTSRTDENGRSPGFIRSFYPTNAETVKPYLLLAGGDDGRAYYLKPVSEATTSWTYDVVTIVDHGPGQKVIGIAVADIDGDGYKELFISIHDMHMVQVFTFTP